MIEIVEQNNGLLIRLTDKEELEQAIERPFLTMADLLDSGGYLGNGWHEVLPEQIGALTEAPIISNDVIFNDDGVEWVGDVYYYNSYMVNDPFVELLSNGEIFLTKA